jgi:hypothetical protein
MGKLMGIVRWAMKKGLSEVEKTKHLERVRLKRLKQVKDVVYSKSR